VTVLNLLAWHGMPAPEALDRISSLADVSFVVSRISSNEDLERALDNGQYDLICPSDYLVAKLVRQGRLELLDHERLMNLPHLAGWCWDMPYDVTCRHSVPLAFGTTGYLAERGSHDGSWRSLFQPKSGIRVGMLGEVREVIGAALKATGHSLNESGADALADAERLLVAQRPSVDTYSSDDFLTPILSRSVQMQHAWSSPGNVAVDRDSELEYVVPREGAMMWVTTAAILSDSPTKETALAVLDALLLPEIAALTTVCSGYATPNDSARHTLDQGLRDNPVLYPSHAVLQRCELASDLGAGEGMMQTLFDSIVGPPVQFEGAARFPDHDDEAQWR
jgi:spermidine/putrescine transport system substrate-binding protein